MNREIRRGIEKAKGGVINLTGVEDVVLGLSVVGLMACGLIVFCTEVIPKLLPMVGN